MNRLLLDHIVLNTFRGFDRIQDEVSRLVRLNPEVVLHIPAALQYLATQANIEKDLPEDGEPRTSSHDQQPSYAVILLRFPGKSHHEFLPTNFPIHSDFNVWERRVDKWILEKKGGGMKVRSPANGLRIGGEDDYSSLNPLYWFDLVFAICSERQGELMERTSSCVLCHCILPLTRLQTHHSIILTIIPTNIVPHYLWHCVPFSL
ncbi:unnamed protein product [Protopolystoma xenopodis]|uniref:Uncharacterized protein n=1 Tax=Protopolystoma xenopodis TaxID=117903 RepID=A0A448WA14_9PLAT|nr:unnamed protein product [Protopolystoma xenopodis]